MDAELVKAPVPIERLAARLRALRQELSRPSQPRRAGAASAAVAYDALLAEMATMVDAQVPERGRFAPGPRGGYYSDSPSGARAEAALARAGVDLGWPA